MKVKEIGRTANIAWSPQQQHPVYMVAGTAAQQLDATFSTSAALELYSLNLGDPSLDMPLVATVPSDCRFHKVAWGCYGVSEDLSNGVIVGGGDSGGILAYDASKFLDGDQDCLMFKKDKHTGAVKALDFNPFQNNLLVSGGAESEIFIWDMNNPDSPMTPGAKSQPPEEVACVSWNRQVQHILASTFTARCVVWDLRKNEPIIKVSDSMSRIKPKLVCWNPEVATQMCLSSEDDHAPVIQLWDLRYATSPVKVLENHQRGILSMSWCPKDPDLLLSCAKDNRILCWNPNSSAQNGEVVYEIPTSHQWSFDVQWCPRNPNVISSSSFDGSITCYSLMGGGHPIQQIDKVSESFLSSDPFTQAMHSQQQQQQQEQNVMPLQKPPKWLKKPVGANFGVNFEKEPREKYIQMLGYDKTELATKVTQHTKAEGLNESIGPGVDANELAKKMDQLGTGEPGSQALTGSGRASPNVEAKTPGSRDELNFSDGGASAFDEIGLSAAKSDKKPDAPLSLSASDDADGLLCQALLTGNFEAAVDMCLCENKMAEAILLAIAGGPELLSRTQQRYFQKNGTNLGRLVSAIVTHDWRQVVNSCELDNWKEALAVILTYSPADEFSILCDSLAARLETEGNGELSPYAGLCYICSGNVEKMVENWINTTQNNQSPLALQDLVEKVMLLRKAVETSRGHAPEITTGVLADKLSNYAEILAAQGRLDTALRYLGESSEVSLTVLRDRLYQALSVVPQGTSVPQCPWQKVNVAPQSKAPSQQRPATYQATANSTFNTNTTGTYSSQGQYSNQYSTMNGTSVPAYSVNNPLTGPGTSSVPAYNSQTGAPSSPTNKGPLSHKYPQPTVGYPGAAQSDYGINTYNPMDYNTNQPAHQPYDYGTQYQPTTVTQPSGPSPNMYQNNTQGYGQPPVAGGIHPNFHSFQDSKPDKAWNDPPMVVKKDKPKPQPTDVSPITNPIYGGQQPVPDQGQPAAQMNYGNFYNPQEYKPEPQKFATAPQSTYTNSHVAPKPAMPEPVKEVPKAPLPEEHKVLQDIFNNLVHNCQARANNAQMKRKLDDVMKKLEVLYDRLRDGTLSPAVIQGLHQIVQTIQQYDYNTGLGIYTQMVSQGNFSEISSFMPGLKMLIQSAAHLQVYVQ
ncbi:protein transport protein Sec31A-like [Ruditapes philippinarum]|uniref:protein transport protein Sec31A-like n=1 Tax=Ruditapes philippinarum TaxID=129788 RepID=UPI00295A645A|nr:protein transport protein Sec31A-like [Ruditapes philippinarum]